MAVRSRADGSTRTNAAAIRVGTQSSPLTISFDTEPRGRDQFLESFKEFPPSQRPSSFSIDQVMEKLQRSFETVGGGQ